MIKRTGAMLLMMALTSLGAESSIAGKWDCRSDDGAGHELACTLAVKDDGGRLSGTITNMYAEIPLIEPKIEGNTFTFQFTVNANCTMKADLKIENRKFEGKFACPEVPNGTLKGTKQN